MSFEIIQERFAEQLSRVPDCELPREAHPEHFCQRRAERWVYYLAEHPADGEHHIDAVAVALRDYLDACREGDPYEGAPENVDEYVDELLSPLAPPRRRCIRRALVDWAIAQEPECPTLTAYVEGFSGENPVKVSAVIPVHNAGDYIHRLIDSLKQQTLGELEFVFVDDVSTDDSMRAVEQWAAEDARVRIIRNEENLGEGGSRNAGIRAARGTYFCSLDPDDWVAPDFFELLYEEARKSDADVVKGTRVKVGEASGKELRPRSKLNETMRRALEEGEPLYLPFNYEHQSAIFRRILFCSDTLYGTSSNACDTTFLLRMCLCVSTISFADGAAYYYLVRSGSATGSFSANRSFAELVSFGEQVEALCDEHDQRPARQYLIGYVKIYASRFFQAMACNEGDAAAEEEFCSQLQAHIRHIPNYVELYENLPELRLLVEGGVLLPPIISSSGDSYKDEIRRWADCLSRPLDAEDDALIQRFAYIVSAAAVWRLKRREGFPGLISSLHEQLLRLSPGARRAFAKQFPVILGERMQRIGDSAAWRLRNVLRLWNARSEKGAWKARGIEDGFGA